MRRHPNLRSVPRMDDVTRLAEIESIKQLKARYFRFLDTKDWDGWQQVFTSDARMDVLEAGDSGRVQGAAAIVDYVRGNLRELVTCHHGHMPEIEITSPTSASGVWAMEDLLRWPPDDDGAVRSLHGWGHYHETYVKLDDGWHIESLKLTRLRVDVA